MQLLSHVITDINKNRVYRDRFCNYYEVDLETSIMSISKGRIYTYFTENGTKQYKVGEEFPVRVQ